MTSSESSAAAPPRRSRTKNSTGSASVQNILPHTSGSRRQKAQSSCKNDRKKSSRQGRGADVRSWHRPSRRWSRAFPARFHSPDRDRRRPPRPDNPRRKREADFARSGRAYECSDGSTADGTPGAMPNLCHGRRNRRHMNEFERRHRRLRTGKSGAPVHNPDRMPAYCPIR